jgi:putative two-component system response regulator
MTSIFIVDDNRPMLARMQRAFGAAGLDNVVTESDPLIALASIRSKRPDVLIVDYNMPKLNGLAMLELLKHEGIVPQLPAVLLSGLDLSELRLQAFEAGAIDVIDKSVAEQELICRVSNFAVAGRRTVGGAARLPYKTVPAADHVATAHLLRTFERLSALNDVPSGLHVHRVAAYAAVIGASAGLGASDLDLLRAAAPLHDIGKIGVADAARRNGRAGTEPSLEDLQAHTTIGYHLLKGHGSPALDAAAQIALTHHESWDGSGFPFGLGGADIPLFGRIVAVADTFELITAPLNRPLHWLVKQARDVIEAHSGTSFDPDIVYALESSVEAIVEVKLRLDAAAIATGRRDATSPALRSVASS